MSKKSLFIVIEGLDGSGKSTASKELAQLLEQHAPNSVKTTYEPNDDCCAGIFIRDVLKGKIPDFHPNLLALAFATNRLDHCHRVVTPWLESGEGKIVLCDRFYLSSLVYQSNAEMNFDKILTINEFARKPDIIFFINVDTKVCYERIKGRNQPLELFERNFDETRAKYFEAIDYLKTKHGDNIVEIDGSGTVEEVAKSMFDVIVDAL
ncbi:MAG TPA: dTMP kinase [Allocoleopsis sp.]